jgi:hydrogenase nickel incorporation protein HypA/HybF
MMNQINAIAQEHHASGVSKVTLHVGPLSGVEPQLLLQAFPLASAGTIASDATLVIESLPIRVRCRSCKKESEVTINLLTCRHCGDYQTQLISGDEMLLANLELSTNDGISDRKRHEF